MRSVWELSKNIFWLFIFAFFLIFNSQFNLHFIVCNSIYNSRFNLHFTFRNSMYLTYLTYLIYNLTLYTMHMAQYFISDKSSGWPNICRNAASRSSMLWSLAISYSDFSISGITKVAGGLHIFQVIPALTSQYATYLGTVLTGSAARLAGEQLLFCLGRRLYECLGWEGRSSSNSRTGSPS